MMITRHGRFSIVSIRRLIHSRWVIHLRKWTYMIHQNWIFVIISTRLLALNDEIYVSILQHLLFNRSNVPFVWDDFSSLDYFGRIIFHMLHISSSSIFVVQMEKSKFFTLHDSRKNEIDSYCNVKKVDTEHYHIVDLPDVSYCHCQSPWHPKRK